MVNGFRFDINVREVLKMRSRFDRYHPCDQTDKMDGSLGVYPLAGVIASFLIPTLAAHASVKHSRCSPRHRSNHGNAQTRVRTQKPRETSSTPNVYNKFNKFSLIPVFFFPLIKRQCRGWNKVFFCFLSVRLIKPP